MIIDDKKSILERVNFFVLFSFDLTHVVIPHLSSLSMTLGLALITILINYSGVVVDDARDDNLQIVNETYNISYIASKVMSLQNLGGIPVISDTNTHRNVY